MVRLPYTSAGCSKLLKNSMPQGCWSVYTTSCRNIMYMILRFSGWHSRTRIIHTSCNYYGGMAEDPI